MMTWNETYQELDRIYRRWRELADQQPKAGTPEWKAWDKVMKDEVRKPAIALHYIRIALTQRKK